MTEKEKNIVEAICPDYINKREYYEFLRAGATADLDSGYPQPIYFNDISNSRSPYQAIRKRNHIGKTWLYPYQYESYESFLRRYTVSRCPGFAKYFLNAFNGYFLKPKHEIKINTSDQELENKIFNNIGGTNIYEFIRQIFIEFAITGKICIFTDYDVMDNDQIDITKNPHSYIIPCENIRKIKLNNDSTVKYIIFDNYDYQQYGYKTVIEKKIIVWSESEIVILKEEKENDYRIIYEKENQLGIIPCYYNEGESIIEHPATYDVSAMNLESVIDDILIKTGIAFVYAPDEARESWPKTNNGKYKIGSDLICWVPQGSTIPGFAAFPPTSLDGHFKFLENLVSNAFKLSGVKYDDQSVSSGIKEQWDFRRTEAVLLNLKNVLVSGIVATIKYWGLFKGYQLDPTYSIGDFNVLSLLQELQAIQQMLTIDMGKTANSIERLKAFTLRNPNTPAAVIDKIKTEIDSDENQKSELKNSNPFENILNQTQ